VQLSRRADYALRAVIDLAVESASGRVQLREIAARQAVPEKYLEQLLRLLKTAGVVHATRGSRGGYQLARPASELSLLTVFEAVEGPVSVEDEGAAAPGAGAAPSGGAGVVRLWWVEITDGLRRELSRVTVAELARRYQQARRSQDDWII
jgi:Rrf2 family protein